MHCSQFHLGNDPKTGLPVRCLHLAFVMFDKSKQNLKYWNEVPVPYPPNDTVRYEFFRQIFVFLPLVPVAVIWYKWGILPMLLSFIVALMLMKSLHNRLQRAITVQRAKWHALDRGRYAFTQFISVQLGIAQDQVTYEFSKKMFYDFHEWFQTIGVSAYREHAESISTERNFLSSDHLSPNEFGDPRSNVFGGNESTGSGGVTRGVALHGVNPISGIPILDGNVDILGNAYGVSDDYHEFNSASTLFQFGYIDPEFSESSGQGCGGVQGPI